ncbi:MAG: SAP domain-containing protein [Nitrosomonadales bacterium]|nr:SAP domain-containing protein [Nitrosomonadales bacterium]
MKLEVIRNMAKSRSIKPGHLSKTELIKTIQAQEGNFTCFATAYDGVCDQGGCLWREDCFGAAHHQGALS